MTSFEYIYSSSYSCILTFCVFCFLSRLFFFMKKLLKRLASWPFVSVICTGELLLDNIDTAGFNSSTGISGGAVNPQTVQFPHTEL